MHSDSDDIVPKPIKTRKGVPFYCEKSNAEFKNDPYEQYDPMVVRQTALHMADGLWNGYPLQPVWDFIKNSIATPAGIRILEVGCSVGRIIGSIAKEYPKANCWGIDFSYQLMKRAKDLWLDGKHIHLEFVTRGFDSILIQGLQLSNLRFGVARAESLPFPDESQDVVISSFLLDRLREPSKALEEMFRVLMPQGKLILVTPLNFTKASHWKKYYPPDRIHNQLEEMNFMIEQFVDSMIIIEPLDCHGNSIFWKCVAITATKKI